MSKNNNEYFRKTKDQYGNTDENDMKDKHKVKISLQPNIWIDQVCGRQKQNDGKQNVRCNGESYGDTR